MGRTGWFALALFHLVALSSQQVLAQDVETSLAVFGDINYALQRGPYASAEQRETFEAFGENLFPKSSNNGFGLVGSDFVLTSVLDERFAYLAEVNLQVGRGEQSELELDVERMFLEYRLRPQLNLQVGMFFTPIGYFNRNLYARAWIMRSIQVPDLFEEEFGLVPTHTVGLHAYGLFDVREGHQLRYAVSVGNGRTQNPVEHVFARDDDGWRSVTGMLEWNTSRPWDITLGLSGWYDRVSTYYIDKIGGSLSPRDGLAQRLRLEEIGVDAHLVLSSRWVNFIGEAVYQRHRDRDAVLAPADRTTTLTGAFVELSANLLENGVLKPYVRVDVSQPPVGGGPYLGLRADDEGLTRVFVPRTKMLMVGAAYDIATHVRLKLESSTQLQGVRKRHSLVGQAAFAF